MAAPEEYTLRRAWEGGCDVEREIIDVIRRARAMIAVAVRGYPMRVLENPEINALAGTA